MWLFLDPLYNLEWNIKHGSCCFLSRPSHFMTQWLTCYLLAVRWFVTSVVKTPKQNKYSCVLWIKFVWVNIWSVADCFWYGNEPSGFIKCGTLGDWISDPNSVWRRLVLHGVGQGTVLRRSHKHRLFWFSVLHGACRCVWYVSMCRWRERETVPKN